ncbi:N-acetylglucosamine-6-phosphate deacetylase [Bacillus smithii]|uniref:N-acetylglucosamine-6-phosphate deacetylase n=1 Tax=Bacillus smithii TaxID=1479 RepID=UPI0022E02855|nr:N-acetylglucosamine-6-phosphate deacetylase [Bacillus smithii]
MENKLTFIQANILLEHDILQDGFLTIENGKITCIGKMTEYISSPGEKVIDLHHESFLSPGFIDVHIHGANGADTMDATPEAITTMASALPKEGTTSFLATTITQSPENIEKAIRNVAEYRKKHNIPGKAEVLGIHLEGPFINEKHNGAQPKKYILKPSIDQFQKWQDLADNAIKLVTLAPEIENASELISYLADHDVIASIGHTDASYEEVVKAAEAGASHVTHLFNAMKGMHHREPGTAGAALLLDQLTAELIADGVHVRPEMIDLAVRMKGEEKIVLITDSMRAKCLKNGRYDLGGQDVIVQDGKAVLEDGTLAGSILKMKDSIKNIIRFTKLSLFQAVRLASTNPAKELKVFDRKGSLAVGKDADIVVFNPQYEVQMTLCRGEIAYKQ